MRVPLSWLRSYCDPGLSADELAGRLAMAGVEADRIERVGVGSPDSFVVGEVVSAEPHPDADRLTVCVVRDGSSVPRTIVCGAPNVAAGQLVAVARPGAELPDGTRLGEVTLRGVTSSGMILAEDEVGIGEDHAGIMVLGDGHEPGTPLIEALQVADEVLDLEVNPNRPDCLGVYGVARDVHAITEAPLGSASDSPGSGASGEDRAEDHLSVEIADPDVCLRFTARVFEDVEIGPSPLWLKQRLTAAGQRPISNVVDITNYVMLLVGQPLHAFDLDEVRGRALVVRKAGDGERMRTLDGVERELDASMALVCDAEGPSGIAGIMGGEISEVSGRTTRVAMEAATWVGKNILRSSRKLGLRTEASGRFEKQLHPDHAMAAQHVAARLMVELCGARMVPGTLDAYPDPPGPRRVAVRHGRVAKLLGKQVEAGEILALLGRLGFGAEQIEGGFDVTVPYWRDSDVQREVDVIEEIARVHGVDKLEPTLPARREAVGRLNPSQRLRRRAEDALRDRGLHEVVSWSFTAPEKLERLRLGDVPALSLSNPLSSDQSVMRPLLLPGLLDAAGHNSAYGLPEHALFESAHVYRPSGPLDDGAGPGPPPAHERNNIAVLLTRGRPGSWRSEPRPADFYAAKGVLEALLGSLRIPFEVEPGERPFLHPGRAASVLVGNERKAGWIGELHPLVAREWDLEGAAAFELDADLLTEEAPGAAHYEDVTGFPVALQDLAVVVDEHMPLAEVEAAVRKGGAELLRSVSLFDVYRGEQVAPGRKSLALRLEFRAPDRTLTDEEVSGLRSRIEAELAEIGGRLRE